jgi:N-formylglutamate deformylase
MSDTNWQIAEGVEPFVATAIHDGHDVRDELREIMLIDEADRFREEDPHTGRWASMAATHIVAKRSRFEFDLNRPRERAIYVEPADAWGLNVWTNKPHSALVHRSLGLYDSFYAELDRIYSYMTRRFGAFVVFDLHSYNHRRNGSGAEPEHTMENPEVNIGTGTMDRNRWAPVVDRCITELSSFDFGGRRLDVRENVKFRGGNHPRWAHERFPDSACVIAVEFKKFFMDEWTGEVHDREFELIGQALRATMTGVLEEIQVIIEKKKTCKQPR